MFTSKVNPALYFLGAIIVSLSTGFMTDEIIGFMVLGIFCLIASFLK